ncbi:prephenate dehydratase [Marseilla massiliensis]|jgi:prephenate dehydratase|uniref:prephenate dehydratase n=1 Tax=Marseilla massiliensis TaxID=1841864 RepID=A0A938WLA1_9BACT|nr:prephenate dehydratase [Marseilla massiliensis]MBM6661966.1 prephenate dehydratase [Marseilla massiliensis]MCL1610964.1 prephenate dehydratase [Marseilla massiliensis]HIV85157.1 prephenate dehydratase [Candidatus Prevotella intestinigallinarum]
MKRVAIQGFVGSFHDIAAHQYFNGEQLQLVCCATFEEVFDNLAKDPTMIGMTAIENTIAGSLLHNYELLRESGLTVVGEHKLHISHCICCLPDDSWETISEVHSHPVALMQCRQFLSGHADLKVVECEDTAGAAKDIAVAARRGCAAICSSSAAHIYGMKVLEDHIEDNKHNFTRFLVSCNPGKADFLRPLEKANKASLVFALPHEEGSLSQVLSILSFYKINLTKIQSLPIIGHEWEYLFYVDVTYDNLTRYRQSIDAITPLTRELKILGEYQDGKQSA